jgi:hypothetical protein
MSARVETLTPIVSKKFLIEALDELQVNFSIRGNDIVTERIDYYGEQIFLFKNGRYAFLHDSSANMEIYSFRKINFKHFNTVHSFLQAVEIAYNNAESRHKEELRRLEEELRRRQEEERKRQIELERNKALDEIRQEQEFINEEKQKLEVELRAKLEEERILTEQKQALVEEQKQKILEKAREMGYTVKQKQKGNNIQLVLVRNR